MASCSFADPATHTSVPLTEAVTNNAVAYLHTDKAEYLVSFSGLGGKRTHADVHANTWVYRFDHKAWKFAGVVPDGQGRLASVAVTVANQILHFGGYTVAENGEEVSLPFVHTFNPEDNTFRSLEPMPVPVDDAVALVYQDRFVYLVSGWHDVGNVNLVQRYDIVMDTWVQATPFPGAPVFGHAGAIVGDQLLVCGGSKIELQADGSRNFKLSTACYKGKIDANDNRRIRWQAVEDPHGASRYRAVAVAHETTILFVGGTDRPYNYNGIGYDGKPADPLAELLSFDVKTSQWQQKGVLLQPSMDHRGLIVRNGEFWLIGGMLKHQEVTDRVRVISIAD